LTLPAIAIDGSKYWLTLIKKTCGSASLPGYGTLEKVNGTGYVTILEAPGKITKALVEFINNIRRN